MTGLSAASATAESKCTLHARPCSCRNCAGSFFCKDRRGRHLCNTASQPRGVLVHKVEHCALREPQTPRQSENNQEHRSWVPRTLSPTHLHPQLLRGPATASTGSSGRPRPSRAAQNQSSTSGQGWRERKNWALTPGQESTGGGARLTLGPAGEKHAARESMAQPSTNLQ